MTIDPDFFEEHTESAEFWSLARPLFATPQNLETSSEPAPERRRTELLDRDRGRGDGGRRDGPRTRGPLPDHCKDSRHMR